MIAWKRRLIRQPSEYIYFRLLFGYSYFVEWSANFAYAVGLITSDGNLSKDGRHISFTSKDLELALKYREILRPSCHIGRKARGFSKDKKYFRVEFSDIKLYRFFESIGIHPRKSKTIHKVLVPDLFFIDFFRGCIDGDGNISVVKHPESRHFQLRLRLTSGSLLFLLWIKDEVRRLYRTAGGFIVDYGDKGVYTLVYAKSDAMKLLELMYYNGVEYYLRRKFLTWAT